MRGMQQALRVLPVCWDSCRMNCGRTWGRTWGLIWGLIAGLTWGLVGAVAPAWAATPAGAPLAACDAGFQTVLQAVPDTAPGEARAVWLDRRLIRWPGMQPEGQFRLLHSARGQIVAATGQVARGADGAFRLQVETAAVPAALQTRFKWLAAGTLLALRTADLPRLQQLHRGQLVLVQEDADGRVRQATAQVADEGVSRMEQFVRQARFGYKIAHQDEQRNHRQGVGKAGFMHHLRGAGQRRHPAARQTDADNADQAHGKCQRQPHQRQNKNGRKTNQGFCHRVTPSPSSEATEGLKAKRR